VVFIGDEDKRLSLDEPLLSVSPPFPTKAARDPASAIIGSASSRHDPLSRSVKGEDLNGKALPCK
jgi:hypothetical protein